MIKKQTNNNIELADEIVSFEKFEKEFLKIEKKFEELKDTLKLGGSKEQLEKLKKINSYLTSI